jgi:hypothetical protein
MGASMEGLRGTLERLSPLVEGQDPRNMAAIRHQLDRALFGNNQAKAGIDINADKGVLQGRLILGGVIAAETAGAGRSGN